MNAIIQQLQEAEQAALIEQLEALDVSTVERSRGKRIAYLKAIAIIRGCNQCTQVNTI